MATVLLLIVTVLFGHCFSLDYVSNFFVRQQWSQIQRREDYIQARNKIISDESNMRIGHDIVLNSDEQKVNFILMQEKELEINKSRTTNGPPFAPSVNFLTGRHMVEQSKVFQLLKLMPKGAALHLHDCSMVDLNWLVKNVTYRPNCYMCTDANNVIHFHFWEHPPANPDCVWKSVKQERQSATDLNSFDQKLYNAMSLIVDDPAKAYPSIDVVWTRFLQAFDQANGLINYAPVFKDYFYEALNEFHLDNVQYLEFRGLLPQVYELNGDLHNKDWVMQQYDEIFTRFTKDHQPNFSGGKFIYSGLRFGPESNILTQVKDSINFLQKYPKHFAGYDLVGQEDPGVPLIGYLDALLYPANHNPPIKLPYFFHAGETDWQGTATDRNLIDAVLLNTSRIGHGYALQKHPEVMQIVKKKQIAVEVNPISNQVLKLVDDLRNHPAAGLIAQDYPIVISADDPSVWGAKGLSYDFYMAFMALAGETADLRLLKKLAINSIKYSAMSSEEKTQAMQLWSRKWDTFLQEVLQMYHSNMSNDSRNSDSGIFGR